MAGAGKKTFTAGEVLTASDVNTYLMEQSVMVFGGTAARSSAIPTPSTGMTTYNQETKQLETYNGSAYVGMSGLQLVKKQTIGTGVSSITVTNAFSATYENYKIVVSGGTASTGLNCHMVLGASATQYYAGLNFTTFATGAGSNFAANNLTTWPYVGYFETNGHRVTIDVLNPFLAKYTAFEGPYIAVNSAGYVAGVHNQNTSYTDFTLSSPGGTVTGGTIYVYGYGV